MAEIHVDTGNLTYTLFAIPELSYNLIEGADAPAILLEPGEYSFQQIATQPSFRFEVDAAGLVHYDEANSGFLEGEGTATLAVMGYEVTIDGRELPHDLQLGIDEEEVLLRGRRHRLALAPALGYRVQTAPGIEADFEFDMDDKGNVRVAKEYQVLGTGGQQSLTFGKTGLQPRAAEEPVSLPVFASPTDNFCPGATLLGLTLPPSFSPPMTERWKRGDLTFSIDPTGWNAVSMGFRPEPMIEEAFWEWGRTSAFFNFVLVPVGTRADIPVVFGVIQPPGQYWATGGKPEDGKVTVNLNMPWNEEEMRGKLVHEIGHSLGLKHAGAGYSTMGNTSSFIKVDPDTRELLRLMYEWMPQENLTERGTTDHAVLAMTREMTLYHPTETPRMVWKGVAGDRGLYQSDWLDGKWQPQTRIRDFQSSHSPALATLRFPSSGRPRGLVMAWKGGGFDRNLYWTRNLSNRWEYARRFPSARSDTRPALANVSGKVCIACAGSNEDRQIYWSRYYGMELWSEFVAANDFRTTDSPALVAVGERLFMFWKSDTGNEGFWSVIDLGEENPVWQEKRRMEYTEFYNIEPARDFPIRTGGAFTGVACGEKIILAWKSAEEDDTATYLTVFAREKFGGKIRMDDFQSSVGPALTFWNNGLLMAWKGTEDDRTIHWTQL